MMDDTCLSFFLWIRIWEGYPGFTVIMIYNRDRQGLTQELFKKQQQQQKTHESADWPMTIDEFSWLDIIIIHD